MKTTQPTIKTRITLSKSGHYTVILMEGTSQIFKATKIYSLRSARELAATEKTKRLSSL